jgi:hypothetical protein
MSRSPSRTLKLTYLGDASQLSKSTKDAGDQVSTLGDRVKTVGKTLAVGFAAVGAAGFAMGKKLFEAFEEVSTANARVEQVVKSMGNFEGQLEATTDRIVKQAEATARLTGVDRNLIKESQALLLTFDSVNKTAGEAGGVFDRATQAAVDLAAAGFGSATSNAQSLGRALEDPLKGLTALTRQGVTFTAEQQELIRALVASGNALEAQGIILGAIETQVGGVAEATANGSARISQSFGILKDRIAQELGPAFEFLVEKALEFVERFADWWDRNGDDIIESFRTFAGNVKSTWEQFQIFGRTLRDELLAGDRLPELLTTLGRLRTTFGETRESLNNFLTSLGGGTAERNASLFRVYIDNIILPPLNRLADGLEKNLKLINNVLDAFTRLSEFFKGRGQLSIPGGDFQIPDGFVPGTVAPTGQRQPNITVNVSGAIDPEGTARTIRRTLDAQALRSGTVPTQGIVDPFFV